MKDNAALLAGMMENAPTTGGANTAPLDGVPAGSPNVPAVGDNGETIPQKVVADPGATVSRVVEPGEDNDDLPTNIDPDVDAEAEATTDAGAYEGEGESAADLVETTSTETLLTIAKEFGYDSLDGMDDRTKKMLEAVAASRQSTADDEDELTPYEKAMLEAANGKDGKDDADIPVVEKPGTEPAKPAATAPTATEVSEAKELELANMVLDGKFPYKFRTVDEYWTQRAAALEAKDAETVNDLDHQMFVARLEQFAAPMIKAMIERVVTPKLGKLTDLETRVNPIVGKFDEIRANQELVNARQAAIDQLSQTTQYKDINAVFARDKGADGKMPPKISIRKTDGSTVEMASSPIAKILKANPHLLDIEVKGKDGQIDHTATLISMLRGVHKHWKTGAPAISNKTAAKLVAAGAASGKRQVQRNAGGGLNGNTTSGGGGGGAPAKTSWGDVYKDAAKHKSLS